MTDVVSETLTHKSLQRTAGVASPNEALQQLHFPPGHYKIVTDPEADTKDGWRIVQVLESTKRVLDRSDAIGEAPDEQHGHGDVYPVMHGHDDFGPRPKRGAPVVTLWRTSQVTMPRFLMVLDEASALASLEARRAAASDEATLARAELREEQKRRAELEKKTEEDAKTLAKRLADLEVARSRETAEIERGRKMERELGQLRAEKDKLVRAVGDLRAKDILA